MRITSLAALGMIFIPSAASTGEHQVHAGVIPAGDIAKGLRQTTRFGRHRPRSASGSPRRTSFGNQGFVATKKLMIIQ